jgi:hypothetical protein
MDRLPISRQIALHAADREAERVFQRPVALKEVYSSASSRRVTENKLIPIHLGDSIKSRELSDWPKSTSALCLHCAEPIEKPLPAVKYHDTHEDKYMVYGYFCRPCCSFAYVQEQPGDTARCLAWTQHVLRTYFGVTNMASAPPRCALNKFGGSMTLSEFYGDNSVFVAIHAPPFVTFAMYAEIAKKPIENGVRRPLTRQDPIAVNESTGKVPLILEFLAARGAVRAKSEEPKRRKTKATGTLTQYLVK